MRPVLAQWTTSFSSPLLSSPRSSQVPTPFQDKWGGVSHSAGLQWIPLPTLQCASRLAPLVFFLLKSLQCFSSNTLWHVDVSASHCNCGKHLRGRLILVPCDLCVASQKTRMHQEKGFLMFCFAKSLAVNCTHRTRHSFASLNVAESAKRSTVCSVDVDYRFPPQSLWFFWGEISLKVCSFSTD